MRGIFVAGELGGMGLIKNSVEQGQQAIESIQKRKKSAREGVLDVLIIGAGPAGISASLTAKKYGLSSITLEQDSLGGTVYTFPRSKIVMTSPMDLPLYGKMKLFETSKDELLELWEKVIEEQGLDIQENSKVEQIIPQADDNFNVVTSTGKSYISRHVLLAIGRRGSPRKLGIPGEDMPKVAYRLLEPERIQGKKIVVVGGGDSAIESALMLMDENEVILSYRKDSFARLKPKNKTNILAAEAAGALRIWYSSQLAAIHKEDVLIQKAGGEVKQTPNDLVFIFIGGELPTNFLQKAGVEITKRFAYIVKKHS